MAWTTPATAVTGDIIPASFWNLNGRDNELYLKGVVDGTGTDKIPGRSIASTGANNADAIPWLLTGTRYGRIQPAGGGIGLLANGYYDGAFKRDDTAAAIARMFIDYSVGFVVDYAASGANPATMISLLAADLNGKVTGKGFYDSGEVTVTNGATATVSHGLGARPRFISAYINTASGNADSKLSPVSSNLGLPSSSQISWTNSLGATRYINFYAML